MVTGVVEGQPCRADARDACVGRGAAGLRARSWARSRCSLPAICERSDFRGAMSSSCSVIFPISGRPRRYTNWMCLFGVGWRRPAAGRSCSAGQVVPEY